MRYYLIDGFNLFHKIRALAESSTPRRDLVQYIKRHHLTGSSANRVAVVFDGFETAELHTDPDFEIVFSENRTADDIIKERVGAACNKRAIVVVSDDREIRARARMEGADVCRPREFLASRSPKHRQPQSDNGDRGLSPSTMMDITEELKKAWIKK